MAKHRAGRKARNRFHGLRQLSDQSAVFLFILFLLIVLFLMDSLSDQIARYQKDGQELAKDMAGTLMSKFTADSDVSSGTALIVKDTINPEVLDALSKMDYSQLKSYLGVDADFAIQLQSLDGEVILIGDKLCIGSKDAKVNGIPCG